MLINLRRASGALLLAGFVCALLPAATGAEEVSHRGTSQAKGTSDDLRLPFQAEYDRARRAAITAKARGAATGGKVKAGGHWIQLSRESRPRWVEHYPYQDGLLISYWDESFTDNSVGDHPGGGQLLPVDAHPTFFHSYDGHLLRPRTLTFDSTFGLAPTDAITVHKDSQPTQIPSRPAVPLFDDRNTYWYDDDGHGATGSHAGRFQPGWVGVDVPATGTQIRVRGASTREGVMPVEVRPAR